MLAKPDVEVVFEEGVAVGVSSEGETAKAKLVGLQFLLSNNTSKNLLALVLLQRSWQNRLCGCGCIAAVVSYNNSRSQRACSRVLFCCKVRLLSRQCVQAM